jgi:hypothetical protein
MTINTFYYLPLGHISNTLAGKIHEPLESDVEDSSDESPDDEPTEGRALAPAARKCQAIAKRASKDAKREKTAPPRPLVQTKITEMEERKKRAAQTAAQSSKPAKTSSPKDLTILDDSSNDLDGVPRVAG